MDNSSGHGSENRSIFKTRVLYADTDKMGIVYHANYFRWFEALRAIYMRKRGRPYTETEAAGIQLPLTECRARYFKPARYEDIVAVHGWVSHIGSVQVHFEYEIYRDNDLLARGETRHATINSQGRPTRVPDSLVHSLNTQEFVDSETF